MKRFVVVTLAGCMLLALGVPLGADQGGGPDQMADAHRAASLLLLERLRRDRPADYEAFCRIRARDVLVVHGAYDHLDRVLAELGVGFTLVNPEDLPRVRLPAFRTVLVNCPGRFGEGGLRGLREFVEGGGRLFTTDWAVLHVIEPAFPGTIRYTGQPTRDDVVSIRVLRPEHHLLRHLLAGGDRHLWWLERESYPFTVTDPRRVEVLVDSAEMAEKYGASPVAATFAAGRGRVVHVVSHAYLQRSELRTDRDRLPAEAFAGDLGFAPGSPPMRAMEEKGLARVPAGELRSAWSAQMLLANLLIDAERAEAPAPEPPPPPRPPPPPASPRATLRADAVLRDGPAGSPVHAIPGGLRLAVLLERDGWVCVETPAGTRGWLPADALSR